MIAAYRRIFVRENNTSWDPESRQTVFDFATIEAPASNLHAWPRRLAANVVETHTAAHWFGRALKLDRHGADREAIDAYRKAIEIDDGHVDARINLGRLLHNAQRHEDAELCYREALEREPNHPIAAFNLGVVLEDRGAIDAAIEHYVLTLHLDPSLPDAHYNLARLYGWRGDRERAARHLARFRALSNDDG